MLNACVQPAESLGKVRSFTVDVHPQKTHKQANETTQYVQNHLLLPAFHLAPTHDCPQPNMAIWHLLAGVFSPPSTAPITITTT